MSALLEMKREEIQPALTEQASIMAEYQDAFKVALATCPSEFVGTLTQFGFRACQLITEARITAELAGAKKAFDREIQIQLNRR